MRIAFVAHNSNLYGASQSLYLLLQHLDRSHVEPLVVCPEEGPFYRSILEAGLDARLLEKYPPRPASSSLAVRATDKVLRLAWRLRYVGLLARFLRAHMIDAVYLNTVQNGSGVLAAKIARVPAICHIRELDRCFERMGRLRTETVLRGGTKFIAVSQATKDLLLRRRVPATRVTVIHNGVDLRRFDPEHLSGAEQLRGDLGLQHCTPICVVGSLHMQKGVHVLLDALPGILAAHPNVRLLVVGDTPPGDSPAYRDYLISRSRSLCVDDRVEFLGFRHDVERYMALGRLLVVPSLEEPFGRVAIEAMALRKAVVATRVGGLPEIVEDGETGLLVPHGDAQALAAAVSELLSSPERADAMGIKGRERALACFDARTYAARVQAYIQSTLPDA